MSEIDSLFGLGGGDDVDAGKNHHTTFAPPFTRTEEEYGAGGQAEEDHTRPHGVCPGRIG